MSDFDWAVAYAERFDFPPFPVKINSKSEKYPVIKGGHGHNDATTNVDQLRQWWTKYPDALIGISWGARGYFVLDVDCRDGKKGFEQLAKFQEKYGLLPPTVSWDTPSGGKHFLFKMPNAGRVGNASPIDIAEFPALDVKGEGGWTVAPPSASWEGAYAFDEGCDLFDGIAPATAPDIFAELVPPGGGTAALPASDEVTAEWIERHSIAPSSGEGLARITEAAEDVRSATDGGRHGTMLGTVKGIVNNATRPDLNVAEAFGAIAEAFTDVLGGDRDPKSEFARAVTGAIGKQLPTDEWIATLSRRSVPAGTPVVAEDPEVSETAALNLIDWPEFWKGDHNIGEWLVEPVVPLKRQVAIVAKQKAGKSLLTLEIAAALATGRPVLGRPVSEPVNVLYLDYEMGETDLYERLEDFGYGPDDDLSRLHYASLPSIPSLDTNEGGAYLQRRVEELGLEVVVLDTMARVVEGGENDADTYRAFWRYTGIRLKRLDVTLLRLDHLGMDASRGARGSSSKGDDPDLVWQMTAEGSNVYLRRGEGRISWPPMTVTMKRIEEPDLIHELVHQPYPPGTADVVDLIRDLGIDWEVLSANDVGTALKEAGDGKRRTAVLAALRALKEEARVGREPPTGTTPGDSGVEPPSGTTGTNPPNSAL